MSIEQQFDLFRDQGYLVVDDMVEAAVLDALAAAGRQYSPDPAAEDTALLRSLAVATAAGIIE